MATDINGKELKHNDLAIYGNKLNEMTFPKFSSIEMNLFWAVASQISNQDRRGGIYDYQEITFTFKELATLTGLKSRSANRLAKYLKEIMDKLDKAALISETDVKGQPYKFYKFNIFPGFEADAETKKLTVQINPKALPYLTKLTENFTVYDLEKFFGLKSKYSKTLYRIISQYPKFGWVTQDREKLCELLGVPKSYRSSKHFNLFTSRILDPAVEELKPIFKGLKYELITEKKGKGRPTITAIKFTFQRFKPPYTSLTQKKELKDKDTDAKNYNDSSKISKPKIKSDRKKKSNNKNNKSQNKPNESNGLNLLQDFMK